jgi:pyruvate kinase
MGGVIEDSRKGSVLVRATQAQRKGFKMKPERGLTFPRADLHLEPLTAVDLTDLNFVARYADLIGYSFVQSAADISHLQDQLVKRRPDWRRLGIIAKIGTAQAVKNLADINVRAVGRQPFGVMIARGDLAVAIGSERLAEMQEEILWLCESAHVPVIWATQVLEEMVKSGRPTRGEMTDAALAGRAECVMLNKGPNVGEAITALRGLCSG